MKKATLTKCKMKKGDSIHFFSLFAYCLNTDFSILFVSSILDELIDSFLDLGKYVTLIANLENINRIALKLISAPY